MSEDIIQNLPNDNMGLILARLDSIDSRLDRVDLRLDGIESRLDRLDSRLDGVESRLTTLEDKVDKRLQETRPIWENALAQIAETRTEMTDGFEKLRAEMREGFGQLRAERHEEFGKVRSEIDINLRRVVRQIDVPNHNILEVRGDLRYLDERVTKLESEPAQ
jgi:chromosome segregation ATPase